MGKFLDLLLKECTLMIGIPKALIKNRTKGNVSSDKEIKVAVTKEHKRI